MSAREVLAFVAGWAVVVGAFFGGIAVERSGQNPVPEPKYPVHADDVGKPRTYEVGWDLERGATYRATCQQDRCAWETFEYIGWVSPPGLVSYRRGLQVRRGEVVTIEGVELGNQLQSVGFGDWMKVTGSA